MDEIVIATRSMNDELFRMSGELIDLPLKRYRFLNTDAHTYFHKLVQLDAEWVVNLDEDAFVVDFSKILKLIEYMKANNYVCAGMPDGGVTPMRFHNPVGMNAYFQILHVARLRERFDETKARAAKLTEEMKKKTPFHLFRSDQYAYDDFEMYYPFFFWMLEEGFNLLYLDALQWKRDTTSTLLMDHEKQPFLVHCWYTRFFEEQKARFIHAYEFCKNMQKSKVQPLSGIDQTFVVNLDRRIDRWKTFEKRAAQHGLINYTRWSAVDGAALALTPEIKQLFEGNDFNWRRGVIGCALSHYHLWKKIIEEDLSCALVLEDDAEFVQKSFSSYWNGILVEAFEKLPQADLIYLGGTPQSYHAPHRPDLDPIYAKAVNKHFYHPRPGGHLGTFSYIISKSGCEKLLARIQREKIKRAIDWVMVESFSELNVFVAKPFSFISPIIVGSDVEQDQTPIQGL